ncbi:hypothetical protein Z042_02595 [Chania multitudinisentens RB-25]|uniref:Uncharacterized protein n=1 Tax=Chania multitudinisentens RB-25 TaxID=1441930 RepID=W0L9D8_9GAMM|nr:hypothetical protein [Chania multitudinisentens]AHG18625.1 hypothetical protein Z042_02595 [Chania multitudinisentens RB-25]
MSETMVVDGDLLQFDPQFGDRTVTVVSPGTITGTGHAMVKGKKLCILGDEGRVSIQATYFSAAFPTPGTGTIKISMLDSSQQALKSTSGGVLIVKGQQFTAMFTMGNPAKSPNQVPDTVLTSLGKGRFITQQSFATVN